MKNVFLKIIALFFLTILLASNILNLHVYLHQQDENKELTDACQNGDNDEDAPCDLCLLALNLNNLDYNNTPDISFESNAYAIENVQEKLIYEELNYNQLFLNRNRNKAPPYFI